MMFFLGALFIGFLGSFHCVGMCGPIALAIPLDRSNLWMQGMGILSYNAGRIFTYSALGIVSGLAGASLRFAGYQQVLSVSLGVILILGLIVPARKWPQTGTGGRIFSFVSRKKEFTRKLFERKSISGLIVLGLLNGLLPCGFVYLGLAGALSGGTPLRGAAFMAAFGAGTIPAMALISATGSKLNAMVRNRIRYLKPYVIGIMAVLFIVRGLNLGIPYLSPELSPGKEHSCCHPKPSSNIRNEQTFKPGL